MKERKLKGVKKEYKYYSLLKLVLNGYWCASMYRLLNEMHGHKYKWLCGPYFLTLESTH